MVKDWNMEAKVKEEVRRYVYCIMWEDIKNSLNICSNLVDSMPDRQQAVKAADDRDWARD